MVRLAFSTVPVLAATMLVACAIAPVDAIAIAPNQFEDPPALGKRDHQRLSAGQYLDSPFGHGCVGTSNLCALARSRAEDTERETLHREAPPMLWKVREDEDYQSQLEISGPSLRLKQFYQRLGGGNYDFKRRLSEAELQRLLERFEEEGELQREDKMHARAELRKQMEQNRLWRNRFRKITPQRLSSTSTASQVAHFPKRPTGEKFSQRGPQSPPAHARGQASTLGKRHFDDEPGSTDSGDSAHQDELTETDKFHANLRQRFARPYSHHKPARLV